MLLDAPAPTLAALLVALVADALLGEPAWLYRRVPHPVVLIGGAISALERRLLRPGRRAPPPSAAPACSCSPSSSPAAIAVGVADSAPLARLLPAGWLVEGLLMSTLLAQRSLVQHVAAVARRPARRPGPGPPRGGA